MELASHSLVEELARSGRHGGPKHRRAVQHRQAVLPVASGPAHRQRPLQVRDLCGVPGQCPLGAHLPGEICGPHLLPGAGTQTRLLTELALVF